ncbi:MAG: PorV/PorQ family protein [Syntrophothermus sp.]
MYINKKWTLLILVLLFSQQIFSFEKTGSTSFQFLKVYPGARASAMAGAFSSVGDNSEAVFYNPASLTSVRGFDASASYVNWFLDIKHYSFSAAYSLDSWGTFGLQGMFTDVGDIEVTRVDRLGFIGSKYNPGLTGETIRPNAGVFGLSYALDLTDRFAFGLTAKYAYDNLQVAKAGTIAFDGGLVFRTGFRTLQIAATVRHFGPDVKYLDAGKSYPLPQTFNIGISGHLLNASNPLLMTSEDHDLLLSYDMVQPRDFDQQHVVALEYSFRNMLYLRGGYNFNGEQEKAALGVGIKQSGVRIDYSYNNYGEFLNSVHRITIGVEVN